jgi:hypothetical protein
MLSTFLHDIQDIFACRLLLVLGEGFVNISLKFVLVLRFPVFIISVADPDPGSGAFLTPGSGMAKRARSSFGNRIRHEQPGSYFRELKNHILG